nr:uncharacterized protein LOC111417768 [Onthophagus taurus]
MCKIKCLTKECQEKCWVQECKKENISYPYKGNLTQSFEGNVDVSIKINNTLRNAQKIENPVRIFSTSINNIKIIASAEINDDITINEKILQPKTENFNKNETKNQTKTNLTPKFENPNLYYRNNQIPFNYYYYIPPQRYHLTHPTNIQQNPQKPRIQSPCEGGLLKC